MSLYCKIYKKFSSFTLSVELNAKEEILALMGASGSGKSMTLRCIAGIVTPDAGKIIVNGRVLFDSEKKINLSCQERKVGLLFQDYALFPNMTVKENIIAGLHAKDSVVLNQLIQKYHLTGLENHYPSQLSGGQKQRCAIARMMAGSPELIMLDEPFSALDSFLRWQLEQELSQELKSFSKTVLLVSHDKEEVFRMSDRISVLHNGHNSVPCTKEELFLHPKTKEEALLTGFRNVFAARNINQEIEVASLGIHFPAPDLNEAFTELAIPNHALLPVFSLDMLNSSALYLSYSIKQITADISSYILTIQLENSKQELYWEVSKELYPQIMSSRKEIVLNLADILYLN